MRRARFASALSVGALSLALAGLSSSCARPRPSRDAPESWRPGAAAGFDLLLVTLDTTRADHLGAYGAPDAETPTLDRLARAGVRFTDALTVAPLTLPAHATMLTGRLPPRHGVRINAEQRLGASAGSTLGEVLGGAGYTTAAFVSTFVLDSRFGIGRGFANYDDHVDEARGSSFAARPLERKASVTTDAYLGWLDTQTPDAKLFAWIHYYDAHAPYAPPPEFARRFAGRAYDGEIAFVDSQLGRVVAALERSKRLERTLIVVVADHGESLGEHGEVTHGHFIYDSTMRVPLIVHAPSIVGAGVVDQRVVSVADLLPTALELLGVPDREKRDGASWVGRRADPKRAVYLETWSPYLEFGWAPLTGLRTLRDKAILAPRREFYDLADDPREEHNLEVGGALGSGASRRDLWAQLEASARAPGGSAAGATAPASGDDSHASVSEEERAQLQALGYLGGAGPAAGEVLADPKDRVVVQTAITEANAAMGENRLAEAEQWLRRAAAASPGDRSTLSSLGKLQLQQGRFAEAERSFRALAARKPGADVAILLAQIALVDGREDEAERRLTEAAAFEPDHGGIFIARGDLALRRGDLPGAAAAYREGIRLDPLRAAGMGRARLAALPRGGGTG
jgi:choline-sulfatase